MEIQFNNDVYELISILEFNGFKAYIVGGAIRNYFLNLDIVDYDVTTNATYDELKDIFRNNKYSIYNNNQCFNVKINNTRIEISPFKGDNILLDLSNRDFTINAIAYNKKEGFIDPYNGINDIKNKIIKSVNSNLECFKYDPNRILRAIRFEIIYDLKMDESLYKDIIKYSYMVNEIHPMKIKKEIEPILLSNKPSLYVYKYKEIFFELFPELKKCYNFNQMSVWHHLDVFNHTLTVMDHTKPILVNRLIALFHDIKKPECFYIKNDHGHFTFHPIKSAIYAKEILSKYSFGNDIINKVYKVIYFHDERLESDKAIIKFIAEFGYDDLDLFFEIQKADIYGQNPDLLYRLEEYDKTINRVNELIKENKTLTYKELNISLSDLEKLNINNPKKILFNVLLAVIDKKLNNNRKELLTFVKKFEN